MWVLAASEWRRASWFEIQGATNESTRMTAASNEHSRSIQRAKPPRGQSKAQPKADKKRAKKSTTQTVNFVRAFCISESILRCVATFLTTSTIPDMLAMCYLQNCSLRRRHDSPPNSAPGTVDHFVQKENSFPASTATDPSAGSCLSGKSTRQAQKPLPTHHHGHLPGAPAEALPSCSCMIEIPDCFTWFTSCIIFHSKRPATP